MNKLKAILKKLFWVDKFEDKSKILTFGAKFFMYCYIILMPLYLILTIISLDLASIIFACLSFVIYPIMYRIVMGFQRLIHGI